MPGSYGPCRVGKYAIEQMRILKDIGFDLPIQTTVSNDAYRDLNLGPAYERLAWKGLVAIDYLQRLAWRTRPYEKEKGMTDKLFAHYTSRIADRVRKKEGYRDVVKQAIYEFKSLVDTTLPRKPLVGINGEIFLRSNRFSNNDLVRVCQDTGLEVVVSPIGEWIKYTSYRNVEDAVSNRKPKGIVAGYIKKLVQEHDERSVAGYYGNAANGRQPKTEDILARSSRYISLKCGSEAVLSIGSGIEWMANPRVAGVISVMPHGCMPGGIVAAIVDEPDL
jgi:predicted nucleotide-binding protein (sugar kinase/HSP70/actin superfamily)